MTKEKVQRLIVALLLTLVVGAVFGPVGVAIMWATYIVVTAARLIINKVLT
jgi:hypothetical protein